MWDTRVVEKIEEAVGSFSVSCKFRSVINHQKWAFFGVYGPQTDSERLIILDELAGIISWCDGPWCIGGDLNVVDFLQKNLEVLIFLQQWEDFQTLFSLVV